MKKAADNLICAIGMLTRLPMPYRPLPEGGGAGALLCFSLVGLIIGALWQLLWFFLVAMRLPPRVAGAALCVFPLLITGFMHMDGLMDVTDALLSGRDREKRLKILKDPAVGAFAVCSFGCLLLVQYAACTDMYIANWPRWQLLFLPALSRCLGALSLCCPRLLEGSRLGRAFAGGVNAKDKLRLIISGLLAALGLAVCGSILAPAAAVIGCAAALAWALRGLGGTSGDVAGFCIAASEVSALIALAATTLP